MNTFPNYTVVKSSLKSLFFYRTRTTEVFRLCYQCTMSAKDKYYDLRLRGFHEKGFIVWIIPLTLCLDHDLPGLPNVVFPAGRGTLCPVVARGPGTLTPAGTCCCSGRKDIPLQAPVAGLGEALTVSHTCWTSLLSGCKCFVVKCRLKAVGAYIRHRCS